MGLQGIFSLVEGCQGYREFAEAVRQERAPTAVLLSSAKPWVVAALWRSLRLPVVLLTPRPEGARRWVDQLQAVLGEEAPVHFFPEREALPYERLVPDPATIHQRLRALGTLANIRQRDEAPPLVVASYMAAAQKTLHRASFVEATRELHVGDRVRLEELLATWLRLGYQPEPSVEVPGTMSRRGGILDIYVPEDSLPARIELVGDRVESIRRFDPPTQRSVESVEAITITPCAEVLPGLVPRDQVEALMAQVVWSSCSPSEAARIKEELALLMQGQSVEMVPFYARFFCLDTLLDYLPAQALLVLDEPSQLEEAARELEDRADQLRHAKEERGELPRGFPSSLASWAEVSDQLKARLLKASLSQWGTSGQDTFALPFTEPSRFFGRLDLFTQEMGELLQGNTSPVVVTYHDQRLTEVLQEAGIPTDRLAALDGPVDGAAVKVVRGFLSEGWELRENGHRVALLTDAEVFGTAKVRRAITHGEHRPSLSLAELTPGSYVVHVDHGVAHFAGTQWRAEGDGPQREYLVLEYAEGDKLYVPTDHLDRVAPYVAPGDHPPTLTRLGSQEWHRITERVKEATLDMARELLELYASRQVVKGFAFPVDSPWEQALEDSFPYVETPDQLKAIADVKRDMQEGRPMDRLVCGDVGFGKTEVAIRAAFKAVLNGMQVAVLVPTTVLAQQHFTTFTQRLGPYSVRVEELSRLRTREQQEEVVKALREGTVDICIGTHRLLQKDVAFKNLGLVVVDEEQRFGVSHKERLKQMRQEVDVLTLSATPIPRTLHMALSSVRDLSMMETPPEERLPVKTYASEESEDLVREAILREIDRGGQVFLVHNRVRGIETVAARIRDLVPHARVGVGHGQMKEESLARVMEQFGQGHLDVLVCTTIIESGLDMPNANTLIINRADLLGLGQLYQLRGRVGRGGRRGYCYLLVPRGKGLTEAAEKRIKTILAATELGSGFRIAMMDLEIRGAGNLLGDEQSGHIQAVGFDLYHHLLTQAVEELRGKHEAGPAVGGPPSEERPHLLEAHARVDLPLPANLPEEYVPHLPTRLTLYRRLLEVGERQEVDALREELQDRFGPLPEAVENLLYLLEVRVMAEQAGVEAITLEAEEGVLRLKSPVEGARLALEKALGGLAQVGNTQIRIAWHPQQRVWKERLLVVLESLDAFQARIRELAPAPLVSASPASNLAVASPQGRGRSVDGRPGGR